MITRIQNISEFTALRDEWNALLQTSRSDCLFLTWEWLHTWWKHLSAGRKLSILALREGGELTALAPLALRPPKPARLLPFRSLEFLGTGFVGSDYLDVIIRSGREQEASRALAQSLARSRHMLELAQLKRGSCLASTLAASLEESGWSFSTTKTGVCPFIHLSGQSWLSYLASLGSQHRYNFQRRLKNLHKQFEVRFEPARTEQERGLALELLIEMHNRRWQERGGSDAFHLPGLVSFHEEFSRLALDRGWLRLFVLWLDGKPAASLYGLRYGGTFYFYQAGFDPAYSKQSVGLLTMGLAIQSAFEEGAGQYDLLHGEEEYKFHWARQTRELERLELYPPRLRGLVCRKTVEFSRAARRMARHVLSTNAANRIAAARIGA